MGDFGQYVRQHCWKNGVHPRSRVQGLMVSMTRRIIAVLEAHSGPISSLMNAFPLICHPSNPTEGLTPPALCVWWGFWVVGGM